MERSPKDYEKNTAERTRAFEFVNSLRGHYLMGRAIYTLLEQLESVEQPYKEVSDIQDLKYIKDLLFDLFEDRVFAEMNENEVSKVRAK